MFFGWNTLEEHIVFCKSLAKVGGTFIVQDVKFGGVPEMKEVKMSGFPSITDGCGKSIRNSQCVDGVGIIVIQEENIVVASIRRCVEVACLIRI
jgi:hypothetical protein